MGGLHFTVGVRNTAQQKNEELPVKSLMDCFMYHSEHQQATKGKQWWCFTGLIFTVVLRKMRHFSSQHNGVPVHLKAPTEQSGLCA